MKLAIIAVVSMLAIPPAEACQEMRHEPRAYCYQGGGCSGPDPVEQPRPDRGWVVWLALLGVGAAAIAVAVRPRLAE